MKHALAPLAVLVALTASACGSDDETSDAASDPTTSSSSSASAAGEPGSDDAFCTALVGNGALEDGSDVEALKEGLAASGIPDDAPQEASKGLDVYLEILAEIDTDATAEDLAAMDDFDLSKAEQEQMNALVQYAGATCAETAAPEGGAEDGTEGGTDEESQPAEGQDDSSEQ